MEPPSPTSSPLEPGRLYRLAWGLYMAMALGGILWIGARQGVIPLRLFFDPQRWWLDLALGIGAGGLLLGIWKAAEIAFPLARQLESQLADLLGPLTPSEVMALALLSGVAEELFFRGAVQGAVGWIPASLLFALLHTGPGPAFRLWAVFAALAGLLLGALMMWRGNLLGPILAHGLVNGVNLWRLADSARLARGRTEGEKEI